MAFLAFTHAPAIFYIWNFGVAPADIKGPLSQSVESFSHY